MLSTVLAVAAGLVLGAVAALKYIAPKTKTTKDDELLAFLEKVLPYLPAGSEAKVAATAKVKQLTSRN